MWIVTSYSGLRSFSPPRVDNAQIMLFPDYTLAVQRDQTSYMHLKRRLRAVSLDYSLLFPAKLRIVAEGKAHFFTMPEAAWEWLESMGRVSGWEKERNPPALRNRCGRARRSRKGSGANVEAAAHAPDVEQLIQERQLLRNQRLRLHSLLVKGRPGRTDSQSWAFRNARR
ncbi:hypothetical protein NDU88_003952 [Pleurodeles waltl]|uniref:Uncharacterized protein n=1 Tax=Pleurodeles waltl TaxID=8319 RepID=A0AAV7MS23_PLEWA|nr:hypothetical protein NDU88_003952 [Pleurodeles waltl]